MSLTVALTDGTTTLTLTDGTNYDLSTWSPRVARRVGKGANYENVLEEITLSVHGSDTGDLLDNLHALRELLDQAQRWAGGQNVDAVVLEYTASSGGDTYSAAVVSVPDDPLIWPESFPQATSFPQSTPQTLYPVVLRFVRRGAWLGDEENQADTGHAIGATVHTVSFAAAPSLPSPLRVRWNGIIHGSAYDIPRGVIVFGGILQAVEAEDNDGTDGGTMTTEDESANFASGDDVMRSSGSSGHLAFIDSFGLSSTIAEAGQIGAFIVSKCSTGSEWRINMAGIAANSELVGPVRSRAVVFSDDIPTVIPLGVISNPNLYMFEIRIEFERLSASGTLDIDYVVFADVSDPAFSSISFGVDAVWDAGGADAFLEMNHEMLDRPHPSVFRRIGLVNSPPAVAPYRGSTYPTTFGADVNYVLALVGGQDETHWRYGDNTTADSWDVNFWRRLAYLVPR